MTSLVGHEVLESVLERAASGDEASFAQIVAAYHDDMARVSFLVCNGDTDVAQEAVQAAWAIVWRKLGSLRDPRRIRPWLMTVAANETRQILRRRGRRAVREIAIQPDVERALAGRNGDQADLAAHLDLRNAIGRLREDDRLLIAMRYAVGLTSGEIGQAIGMTSGGVRARLARVLDRLREDLSDE